jgi:hypothetical protein
MAIIKPGQLSSGSYSISGSFSGSFFGDGSNLVNLPIPQIETGSFVTTSSFNAFTGSYNTGSFTGSFIGDGSGLTGIVSASYALTASYAVSASYEINYETSSSYAETASVAISASYAETASFVQNAQTASYVLNAVSSSFSTTASFATNALSASFASTVPASGVIGLNLSQIATGSVTASVSSTQFTVTSGSITELVVRGTGVTMGSATTDIHSITGSALITGSLGVTGSASILAYTSSAVKIFSVRNSTNTYDIISNYGSELTIIGRNESSEPRLLINRAGSTKMTLAGTTDLNIQFQSSGFGQLNSGAQGWDIISSTGDIRTRNSSTFTLLKGNFFGIGQATPAARLDVLAQGALSTDIAFRVRNSADNNNFITIAGNGDITVGNSTVLPSNSTFRVFSGFGGGNYLKLINDSTSFGVYHGIDMTSTGRPGYFSLETAGNQGSSITRFRGGGSTSANAKITAYIDHPGDTDKTGHWHFRTQVHLGDAYRAFNTNLGRHTLLIETGSAPTTSSANSFIFYSSASSAGNAAPHFRTENGSTIKLYQQSSVTSSQGIADALTNLGFLTGSSTISSTSPFPYTGSAQITGSLQVTGSITQTILTLTDAATIPVNASISNDFKVTLTDNRILGNPTGAADGQTLKFAIRQDGTGGRTLSFDTKYRFGFEIGTPIISAGANTISYIGVRYNGDDDKFDVIAFVSGY